VLTTGTGQFYVTNTSETVEQLQEDSIVNVTYTYCPTGYVNIAWGRTTADLVPGFFAIALMLVAIGLFFSIYQDMKFD